MTRTRLSVNINKVALLRNSRGGNIPDVLRFAKDCEAFGADGITVHPRPDERHIRYSDVYALANVIETEFNIEGYPSERWLKMVLEVRPTQATLVPDPPDALTSNAGWDVIKHRSFLEPIIARLKAAGIRVSLFVETDLKQIEAAKEVGADRIELYTGPYAERFFEDPQSAIAPYVEAARLAEQLGLGLNAGHDLNLQNLPYLKQHLPNLLEVSIGHALISDALYLGIRRTIAAYKACLRF